eukprot:CAMPEP_0114583422 /NCGR_PEP_ID=MMETSP0125-20121206/7150_1 /TAXON_ID=485358 ORGANISM="Aristerostoma sp., Strain ATCC 50986" /NCGR_SAMPLE_ID=MMETSP0125 /ASSEMBLY_ACC=CAM_ASM_000245 /LENGTH=274 /DNA_ID=CAMNT_0001776853 /DNA_START=22 /DNA_END=846 /DNA_ORIENTATION=-
MSYTNKLLQGGFNFDNHLRNKALADKKLVTEPKTTKTGTTIVGLIYKDGVVIAADSRATGGSTVMDKDILKIHRLADNIYCCGAGTAADCNFVTLKMEAELELIKLNTGRQSRISTAVSRFCNMLFRYQGYIGTALIVGGVDVDGAQLCSISPHGNCSYLPYATMGSGSLAAMSIFEAKYQDDLTLEQARALAIEAIEAGIIHDEGSGSTVNLCVITNKESKMEMNVKSYNKRDWYNPNPYKFPKGSTPFFKELIFPKVDVTNVSDPNQKMIAE